MKGIIMKKLGRKKFEAAGLQKQDAGIEPTTLH